MTTLALLVVAVGCLVKMAERIIGNLERPSIAELNQKILAMQVEQSR